MRVMVAMSGGVDSSVAAGLLVEAGHEVIGVHLKLHSVEEGKAGHCCGLDDVLDARGVANHLHIPFYVLNLKEAFEAAVIAPFIRAWTEGLTPNPCVACNGVLKFDVLLKRAMAHGADALATGHYARTEGGRLFAAAHPAKDQSYFLYPVRPDALVAHSSPWCAHQGGGSCTRPPARARHGGEGRVDGCLFPSRRRPYPSGVGRRGRGRCRGRSSTWRVGCFGHHDAYWRFTIGQRRGVGLARGEPVYVLRVDPNTRRVVVGPRTISSGRRFR